MAKSFTTSSLWNSYNFSSKLYLICIKGGPYWSFGKYEFSYFENDHLKILNFWQCKIHNKKDFYEIISCHFWSTLVYIHLYMYFFASFELKRSLNIVKKLKSNSFQECPPSSKVIITIYLWLHSLMNIRYIPWMPKCLILFLPFYCLAIDWFGSPHNYGRIPLLYSF
jgi:hypothetical protein